MTNGCSGKTCEACVESKIPYNTADMVMSQMPLPHPKDKDLFHSRALFCSQALVLVLRECLEPEHPLQTHLAAINSRTISPSQVFEVLKQHCIRKTKTQVFHRA